MIGDLNLNQEMNINRECGLLEEFDKNVKKNIWSLEQDGRRKVIGDLNLNQEMNINRECGLLEEFDKNVKKYLESRAGWWMKSDWRLEFKSREY